jgi:hypothetical protein
MMTALTRWIARRRRAQLQRRIDFCLRHADAAIAQNDHTTFHAWAFAARRLKTRLEEIESETAFEVQDET